MYSKDIENIIDNKEDGELFIINDFLSITSYENVKKIIQRLIKKNKLEKIIDGIYMKPKYSKTWDMKISCNIYDLADCIARKNGWDIIPTGEVAINYFGLSTQLQSKYIYVSSGPYRNYEYEGNSIYFKHTASKKLFNLSKNVKYLIQAINYYGKNNFDENAYNILKKTVSDELVNLALEEAVIVDSWIYNVIKKIKEYKEND